MYKKEISRMVEIARKYNNPFLPSSLSALPIIDNIYKSFNFKQDVFILSKGHAALALYVILERYGFSPDVSKLHCVRDINNGIGATTGSLGHGLPIATGMALSKAIKKEPGKVYVLLGDGECQEGTFWESALIINEFKLDNIIIHIDCNGYQSNKEVSSDIIGKCIGVIDGWKIRPHFGIKGSGLNYLSSRPWIHTFNMSDEDYKNIVEELNEKKD